MSVSKVIQPHPHPKEKRGEVRRAPDSNSNRLSSE